MKQNEWFDATQKKSTITLSDEVVNCLEDHDWTICSFEEDDSYDDNFIIELETHSDLGEDFIMSFWFDGTDQNFLKELYDYAEDFDAEEHAAGWYALHGEKNAPTSLRALLNDADSLQEQMDETFENLRKIIKD